LSDDADYSVPDGRPLPDRHRNADQYPDHAVPDGRALPHEHSDPDQQADPSMPHSRALPHRLTRAPVERATEKPLPSKGFWLAQT
jgi:hypothetical protein